MKIRKDINEISSHKPTRTCYYRIIRKDKRCFHRRMIYRPCISPNAKQSYAYIRNTSFYEDEKKAYNILINAFRNIYDDSSDTIIIVDFDGNILAANKRLFQFNFSAERSIKKFNIYQFFDKEYHDKITERIEELKSGNSTSPFEYRITDDSGRWIFIEMNSQPIEYRNKKAILTRIRDITHHKEMEQRLMETIIETQEKERQRFAENLHDELGPFLSGIKLYINELGSDGIDGIQYKELLEYMRKMTDEAIEKTRIISSNLMSNTLVDFGISTALTSFVEKLSPLHQIQINLDVKHLKNRFDKTLEVIIYRIIIELINNSLKHARPQNIDISLNQEKEFIKVFYKDDGNGFNMEEELKSHNGIGLRSIIERLKSKQASFKYASKTNEGMQFEFNLPLKNNN
jgi:PAS domain S-box-containing protein